MTASLSATPLILEDYEHLEPGAPEPNFPGLNSNHPTAVLEVAAEIPGEELFYPGNTRYFRWFSLSGQNPDPAGSNTQYHGGPTQFVPFDSETADVVSVGFDFIIDELHSELLFGIGELPSERTDDQNFAIQIRIRGPLGLTNRPEIVGSGANREFKADIQMRVPYRIEIVANKSGAPITYESPLGIMTVGNERYDIYLFNHQTKVLQLLLSNVEWKHFDDPGPPATRARAMQGIWWGTFRYDGTGRSVDIRLNDIAVYEDEIVLTGHEFVPPGPATAIVDFEDDAPATDINSPLWNLPGNIVEDSDGVFGSDNTRYFHMDRRMISENISNRFRFNGVIELLSLGFDIMVMRDDVIQVYTDAHDEGMIAITGGDTAANVNLTVRINIRGTRTDFENPSDADPSINIVHPEGSASFRHAFDWKTPYRIEVVLNQTGDTIVYNTPWADDVSLENETLHLYLYNYSTGENVATAVGRARPYIMEVPFLNGIHNPGGVAGNMADIFWKHSTGRRMDLKLDNITIYENAAVVTDPSMAAESAPQTFDVQFTRGNPTEYQTEVKNTFLMRFTSETGMTYGLRQSVDMETFSPLKTIVPADSTRPFTEIEVPLGMERRFFQVYPRIRGD